jgi:hypothetical protein
MVSSFLASLILAATGSAQITTSFVRQLVPLDTDKIGYVGSVVAVNNSQTSVVLFFDNGTDASALSMVDGTYPQTMIIGPNLWGQQDDINFAIQESSTTALDANRFKLYCEGANAAAVNWTCTASYGPAIVGIFQCNTGGGHSEASTEFFYNTHSYPARLNYSAGSETILHSFVYAPDRTSIPDWCSGSPQDYPGEGSSTTFEAARTEFATYQVVLTAGLEKLDATQAATPTIESATPTGSGNATASAGSPDFTGAAASLAGQQLLVGMGAAVAAFLL